MGYPEEMKYIFNLANSTNGLNADCIAAMPEDKKWTCNFAEMSYQFIKAPIFPFNSALDSWQTGCIYTSRLAPGFPAQRTTENGECTVVEGWQDCSNDPEKCEGDKLTAMNQYIQDFETIIRSKRTYSKVGNGAFIHSCHTHCEALGD